MTVATEICQRCGGARATDVAGGCSDTACVAIADGVIHVHTFGGGGLLSLLSGDDGPSGSSAFTLTRKSEHGRAEVSPAWRPWCMCGAYGVRDEKFDAYYCPINGTWLEQVCKEPKCQYCSARPAKHDLHEDKKDGVGA
jgi:hypothetical protein